MLFSTFHREYFAAQLNQNIIRIHANRGLTDREERDVDAPTAYRGPGHRTVAGSHLRRRRRMLRKKLASTVWNPSAVSVVPGMTSRMVRA